jgi:Cryptococcal mannosyltransferase 1
MNDVPRVTIPSGESLTRRIAFLAKVRNGALRPLETSSVSFDKLIFINDVMFDPIDAVQLLFSTNIGLSGRPNYGAACAVDFINAFKFYDRYATRDAEGYTSGIPFFPWFTDAGEAASRRDVLAQKDAVRVRSCWGGMAAFEAKWFQPSRPPNGRSSSSPADQRRSFDFDVSPLRFRSEQEIFWEASECCLINADLTYLRQGPELGEDSGIFMNPYIRVAYDTNTLRWLPYTRRVERLYSSIHNFLNHLVGMPERNPRRLETPGDEFTEAVWEYDDNSDHADSPRVNLRGSYQQITRTVSPGRFCGERAQMVLMDHPEPGQPRWKKLRAPRG